MDRKNWFTLLLAFVFIGLGSYRVYLKFYENADIPTYRLVLSVALIVLGFFQIAKVFRKKDSVDSRNPGN